MPARGGHGVAKGWSGPVLGVGLGLVLGLVLGLGSGLGLIIQNQT